MIIYYNYVFINLLQGFTVLTFLKQLYSSLYCYMTYETSTNYHFQIYYVKKIEIFFQVATFYTKHREINFLSLLLLV